jgi:hypothetical protein
VRLATAREQEAANMERLKQQQEELASKEAHKLAIVSSIAKVPVCMLKESAVPTCSWKRNGPKCCQAQNAHSQGVTCSQCIQASAAAEEAAASTAEQLADLQQRIDARRRWLDNEQAALDAKVADAIAPAAAQRDQRLSTAAALRQEVEALRCEALALIPAAQWQKWVPFCDSWAHQEMWGKV